MFLRHREDMVFMILQHEAELAKMGYKQELKRELGLMQNFGVSFSIISVITGIPSLFLYGLNTGGPSVMVYGWIIVSFFTLLVGMAMAEVCSAHPTSGGPYFWAAMLSKPKNAPLASWITGWFNLLGQVAVTTGISFACASFISTLSTFKTGFVPSPNTQIGVYAAVLFTQGHFVFQTFIDGTGGWAERASPAYVAVTGILMAQYTLTGFDASAHMTEETTNAAMSGSIGIIMAIGVSALLGMYLLLGLLFSIQDLDTTINSATGEPVAQIFLDCVGEDGAIVLMIIVIGAMYFCGCVVPNVLCYVQFANDFFAYVNTTWRSPIRTVWLACTLSFILGLPSLGSAVAFSAATSIATIGLYISYGKFDLGSVIFRLNPSISCSYRIAIAITAVIWIAFISIVFILPQENPVDSQTLNYAIVAVGIVITYSFGYWLISARKWFAGPVKQIAAEEMGINVMEPGSAGKDQ
ncbi:APC amino acid permease [Lentinula edodes]|uniref:APC amino acid permease n=1 Tax=Lentinula edodes TaxID=5353 RepID=A0A1Q3E0J0_LENED|nr:APC amino acid permease [Lentinula edodes]